MNRLLIYKDGVWTNHGNYSTYREAILIGKELAPFSYTIDTGDRIPTREEQLGEVVQKTKRQKKLDLL